MYSILEGRRLRLENEQLRARVSELTSENSELRGLVEIDGLTGCLSRRGLFRLLQRAIAFIGRYPLMSGRGTCLLLLDLDGLKNVNDVSGHVVGDAVLTEIAQRLTKLVRTEDGVGRLGGDEFVVILWNIYPPDAELKKAQFEKEVALLAGRRKISDQLQGISIGMTWLRSDDDPLSAIERADREMYRIKRGRRRSRRDATERQLDGSASEQG